MFVSSFCTSHKPYPACECMSMACLRCGHVHACMLPSHSIGFSTWHAHFFCQKVLACTQQTSRYPTQSLPLFQCVLPLHSPSKARPLFCSMSACTEYPAKTMPFHAHFTNPELPCGFFVQFLHETSRECIQEWKAANPAVSSAGSSTWDSDASSDMSTMVGSCII